MVWGGLAPARTLSGALMKLSCIKVNAIDPRGIAACHRRALAVRAARLLHPARRATQVDPMSPLRDE